MDTALLLVFLESQHQETSVCSLGLQLQFICPREHYLLTNLSRAQPDQASPHCEGDKASLCHSADLEGWEGGSGPRLGRKKEAGVCREQSLL